MALTFAAARVWRAVSMAPSRMVMAVSRPAGDEAGSAAAVGVSDAASGGAAGVAAAAAASLLVAAIRGRAGTNGRVMDE